MNETLRAKWIQADADVAAAKRRLDLATVNRLAPQRAIEAFRAEAQAAQLRLDAEKRTREAAYIEEQRETKREFGLADRAYIDAQRALVRAERELAEDAENERLKKEREDKRKEREEEKELAELGKQKLRHDKMEEREARDWNNRAL